MAVWGRMPASMVSVEMSRNASRANTKNAGSGRRSREGRSAMVTATGDPPAHRPTDGSGEVGRWRSGCISVPLDDDGDAVGLVGDGVDRVLEASDPDDAGVVADVAVVEDEVATGSVVADLVDLGVRPGGHTVGGQGPRQTPGLL